MSDELKPCLCGEAAIVHELNMGDCHHEQYQIWCNNQECGWEGGVYETKEEAERYWNTRPIEDRLRAQLEFAKNDLATHLTELAAARAEVERLRGIIRKAEWEITVGTIYTQYECPVCGCFYFEDEPREHHESCPFYQWEGGAHE